MPTIINYYNQVNLRLSYAIAVARLTRHIHTHTHYECFLTVNTSSGWRLFYLRIRYTRPNDYSHISFSQFCVHFFPTKPISRCKAQWYIFHNFFIFFLIKSFRENLYFSINFIIFLKIFLNHRKVF